MRITRTEQIWVKPHKNLSWLCHLSKNLYNEGNYQIHQEFFSNTKWIRYYYLYQSLKTSKNYKALPAQTAQQVLKVLERNWKSFFAAIKEGKMTPPDFRGNQGPQVTKPRMESLS